MPLIFSALKDASIEDIEAALDSSELTWFHVYAPGCDACTQAEIIWQNKYSQQDPPFKFLLINVQKIPQAWDAFGLAGIPADLVVSHGDAWAEHAGLLDSPGIDALLEAALVEKRKLKE